MFEYRRAFVRCYHSFAAHINQLEIKKGRLKDDYIRGYYLEAEIISCNKRLYYMTVLAVSNRQYSYSPTVLERVGLDHECETHAGHVSPTGQTNTRKLRLSLPNLRKIFSIVKFRRAYTLERDHYFGQQRKIYSLLLRKTAIRQLKLH